MYKSIRLCNKQANVMLEYSLDEAQTLLQKNSDHADANKLSVSLPITQYLLIN